MSYEIESVDSSGRLNSTAHSFPHYQIFRRIPKRTGNEDDQDWERTRIAVGLSVVLLAGLYSAGATAGDEHGREHESVKHVLLISFDGLHEQDVARCIGSNACPNLALLAKSGTTYTNAHTPGLSGFVPRPGRAGDRWLAEDRRVCSTTCPMIARSMRRPIPDARANKAGTSYSTRPLASMARTAAR